jgi:hypothetical protein
MQGTVSRKPAADWRLYWIADYLSWPGESLKIGRARDYRFPNGGVVYSENRQRSKKPPYHHWFGFETERLNALCNNTQSCHVLFLTDFDKAVVLNTDALNLLRDRVLEDAGRRHIALYPDLHAHGKNYDESRSDFVTDALSFSDLYRQREALIFFPSAVGQPTGHQKVETVSRKVTKYRRSIAIAAWVTRQSGGKCESCGNDAPFCDPSGSPFLETHHLKRLADGGPDTLDNTIAVCPNCHRELHHGQSADALRRKIIDRIDRLRSY